MRIKLYRHIRTQISRVKIWAAWAKGAENGSKNGRFFLRNTMKSHLFATGQIDLKFRQKRQSMCSIEPYSKNVDNFSLRGRFCLKTRNRHFRSFWPVSVLHAFRSHSYVSGLR